MRAIVVIDPVLCVSAEPVALSRLAPQYGELESRDNQTTFETMAEGGGWSQVPAECVAPNPNPNQP